jgi:signal transduction histidine kinase
MSSARAFLASMTGRIFLLLTVGMIATGSLAIWVTGARAEREFRAQLLGRTADRLESYVAFLDSIPISLRTTLLSSGRVFGIDVQPATTAGIGPDPQFQTALAARRQTLATAEVERAHISVCFPEVRNFPRADVERALADPQVRRALRDRRPPLNLAASVLPTCRLVTLRLSDGTPLRLSIDTPWVERERNRLGDPAFLVPVLLALVILAYLAARIAAAAVARLSKAAVELGQDLDRPPVEVIGPLEVQRAAEAFNAMQCRLQLHVRERTHLLAAITHDLQTPLTRLRLRLERVEDEALRTRLITDLNAMKELVLEGLELARSAETAEPRVSLDLDSLLESLIEDAADAGADAQFEEGCHSILELRPMATRRLFSNLIENAIKYGGCAVVSAKRAESAVTVCIRDRGPGLPKDMLERVFEPFMRVEDSRSRSTGGAGLGLTIARMLSEKLGATLTLRNRPEGGLEAIVHWPRGATPILRR